MGVPLLLLHARDGWYGNSIARRASQSSCVFFLLLLWVAYCRQFRNTDSCVGRTDDPEFLWPGKPQFQCDRCQYWVHIECNYAGYEKGDMALPEPALCHQCQRDELKRRKIKGATVNRLLQVDGEADAGETATTPTFALQ